MALTVLGDNICDCPQARFARSSSVMIYLGRTCFKVTRCRSQKRSTDWPKTNIAIENVYSTLRVMLREACVCYRDAPKGVSIRLWQPSRDDSSHVLIVAFEMCRSGWTERV